MIKILRGSILIFAAVVLLGMLTPTTFAARPDVRERLKELGGAPCPNSAFTCVTLTVPLDHFNALDTRTMDVVFAILPTTGERKGMFVTATGGPGSAGIGCCADYYTSFFPSNLTDVMDIVFFDQRGVGLSGGLDCFHAASQFYQADLRADTPARGQKLKNAAQTFADDCDAEMGHPEILPYLGTTQAVEDLELFRQMIGDEKFWLYGESYGTQYAQTYAHAHPDHLAGMILDGVVDLTPDGIAYYADAAQSFNDTLVASLAQCEADENCAGDFGIKPLRGYDQLAKMLAVKKQTVNFPLGNGARPSRKFGFGDLETIGVGHMYGEGGRMMFVRALAKYARDADLIPLARLLYLNLGIDETTLKPSFDPTWSDAYYYGVECQDYGYFMGTNEARADQYIAQALAVDLSPIRLGEVIWGDLPCVYWRDSLQDTTRPPHWNAAGIPTIVMNALADPITPIGSARAVYDYLDDGYLITQRGGPHVIFERGIACIDDPVIAFLVEDVLPSPRERECPGVVMTEYVPLAPADARAFSSPLEAMQAMETEINYLPEFYYWDYATLTRVGCGEKGTLQFAPDHDLIKFSLKECAFTDGFEMTGTGDYDFVQDRFQLKVDVTGYQTCELKYERVGDKTSLKGRCAGSRVQANGNSEQNFKLSKPEMRRAQPGIWRTR